MDIPIARIMMKCRDCDDGLVGATGAVTGLGVSVLWTNRTQRLLNSLDF